ncbi:hypothetical protein ABB07_37830 [Streptomyces incarnatus]|uniref:Uncharacterized protein n=1 Tax=Streptomyces incarnatus TaxID=665007 RepID=A0ABM5TWX5_9ACTN|nr:hypothetical protein ABB07_37830 [Streptomyces incarnatus]
MDDSAIPLVTPAAPRLPDPEPGEWETRRRPVRGRRLLCDQAPSEEWQFATTTVHAAGEDMRNLTAEIPPLIASVAA